MDALTSAKLMYDRVNVAGKVNNTVLDSGATISSGILDLITLQVARVRREQQVQPQAPLPRRVGHAVPDLARLALARGKIYFGLMLWTQRSMPLLWLSESPLPLPWIGLKSLLPAYPLGELLVGRGHDVPYQGTLAQNGFGDWLNRLGRVQHEWTRYGLLGSLLEDIPVRLADTCERKGQLIAAAGCMYAAVVGRLLLQAPRLALGAAAVVHEATVTVLVGALFLSVNLGLRGLRAGLQATEALTGADLKRFRDTVSYLIENHTGAINVQLIEMAAADIPEDDETIDDPSSGRDDRMRRRANVLMRRFGDINPDAPDGFAEISQTADRIAEDLRRYCSRHPDPNTLRFGLSLVKNFLEVTYEPDGYRFEPAELAVSA